MHSGIIFDMDDTILSSRIDFSKMKKDTARTLRQWGALPKDWQLLSTGELIEGGASLGITKEQCDLLWRHVAEMEREGLGKALPEPGAVECLHELKEDFELALLTNNIHDAALETLAACGLADCFSTLVGRGEVSALKPDPAGYRFIMDQYPEIRRDGWIAIGDAWLDGVAAVKSGIDFASYESREVDWANFGVTPVFAIPCWDRTARKALLDWKERKML